MGHQPAGYFLWTPYCDQAGFLPCVPPWKICPSCHPFRWLCQDPHQAPFLKPRSIARLRRQPGWVPSIYPAFRNRHSETWQIETSNRWLLKGFSQCASLSSRSYIHTNFHIYMYINKRVYIYMICCYWQACIWYTYIYICMNTIMLTCLISVSVYIYTYEYIYI